TLAALRPQLEAGDRVLVVADNCSDRTAEAARRAAATVVERHDPERRGKGFALDFGVRALDADPPNVVIVLDADCLAADGAVGRLVRAVASTGRPAQAAYVLVGSAGDGARERLSAFAFL